MVYAITPNRFFASLKQANPQANPWIDPTQYAVGSVHVGTVVSIVDWGCQVEIRPGVTGMILLEKYPGSYHVGSNIEVEVAAVQPELKKIELKPR